MTVARTAAQYGAIVRNSTEVVSLITEADRVVGAKIRDVETGERRRIDCARSPGASVPSVCDTPSTTTWSGTVVTDPRPARTAVESVTTATGLDMRGG